MFPNGNIGAKWVKGIVPLYIDDMEIFFRGREQILLNFFSPLNPMKTP